MESLLKRIANALDNLGVGYMIIGGQAVLIYGEPRLTRDIDITIAATPEDLETVLKLAEDLNLRVLVEDAEEFVKRTWVLPAHDPESGFRVDFIFSWTPYERQAMRRVTVKEIGGYPVKFASPEDLIILKIVSGRPRDFEDVKGVLRRIKVDESYILHWLGEFSKVVNRDLVEEFRKTYREALGERGGEHGENG